MKSTGLLVSVYPEPQLELRKSKSWIAAQIKNYNSKRCYLNVAHTFNKAGQIEKNEFSGNQCYWKTRYTLLFPPIYFFKMAIYYENQGPESSHAITSGRVNYLTFSAWLYQFAGAFANFAFTKTSCKIAPFCLCCLFLLSQTARDSYPCL